MKLPKCSDKKAKDFAILNELLWDDKLAHTFRRVYQLNKLFYEKFYGDWTNFSSFSLPEDFNHDFSTQQRFCEEDIKSYICKEPRLVLYHKHMVRCLRELGDFYLDGSRNRLDEGILAAQKIEDLVKEPLLFFGYF